MLSQISAMPDDAALLVNRARRFGFDKCMYVIEVPDGETDQPIEAIGAGLSAEYRADYLKRVQQDPLRRMVARGEIEVGNTPIAYENTGSALSIASGRRLSSSDTSLLRWCLAQGIRTGIGFRIRMSQGRHASVNFYSAEAYAAANLEAAMPELFLIGHQLHARLERDLPRRRDGILSKREAECLSWIARGLGNRQIAETLGLSVETVKDHVRSLFNKLQVNSRAQAVMRGSMLAYLD